MKLSKKIKQIRYLTISSLLLMGINIFSQTTVSYTGMSSVTCPASPMATISPAVAGLTFSQISRGSGVACGSAASGISGSGFNTTLANAITNSKWYTFNITSDGTVNFSVSSLSIVSQVSTTTASSNVSIQYSIDGGAKTAIGSFTPTTASAAYTITPGTPISVGSSQTLNIFVIPNNLSAAGTTCRVNNNTSITLTTTPSIITPTITASPASLTGLNYIAGNGPSAEQTFTCSGSSLTNDILLTAPTNYEISTTSSAGFGTSVTLTQSSGIVASTTIYVRLIAGLSTANYNGEVISITSTGASAKTVTCSGTVSIIVTGVFINELLVNPSDGNDGSNSPNTSEWIELYNSTGATVDIGCWVITDGDFAVTIPSGTTLASGAYFTIASAAGSGLAPNLDWALCSCTSGASSQVGILTNGAEQVLLYDAAGTLVDAVIWGGGQLPGSMSAVAVGSCGAQTLNFPATGSFENIGTISDGVANERDTDGSSTWGQAGAGSFGATNGSPLPIELLSFSGKISGEDVLLSWATASETNNDFFTIERSKDGTEYINIAEVNGAGNSSSILNYLSYDYEPLPGINYYRLKQTDFDGRISYSQIISIEFNTGITTKIFPNPANDFINIDISGNSQEKLQLQIITCLGIVIKHEIASKNEDLQYTLNVIDLSPGTYILQTITDTETRQTLFIKK